MIYSVRRFYSGEEDQTLNTAEANKFSTQLKRLTTSMGSTSNNDPVDNI